MKTRIHNLLAQVATETFEKLAFLFAMVDTEQGEVPPQAVSRVAVTFRGPFAGRLLIKLAQELLPELAANMLGSDETSQVTLEQQCDALKETANVICGNLLPKIGGSQAIFEIDAPRMLAEGEPDKAAEFPVALSTARLSVEDTCCDVLLFVDGPLAENGGKG